MNPYTDDSVFYGFIHNI